MESRKVVKNAGWIIGTQIIRTLLGLAISMLTARYLGPSNFGLVNYAASLVAFATPIMHLGLNNTLVQEIVEKPDNEGEILGTSIGITFGSSVLCIIGILSFSAIANAGEKTTILVCGLYSVVLIFQSLDMIKFWFQAKLLSKYSSVIALIGYITISAYRIFLLASGKSVYWFAVANTIDIMIISISLLWVYRKIGNRKLAFSISTARKMLGKSKYYILSDLMIVVFSQTDRIMLKLLINETEVGYYSSSTTIAAMAGLVFVGIMDSMRPEIFKSIDKGKEQFEKNVTVLYSIVIYTSLIYGILVTLFAPLIISILYGVQYAAAVPVLQIIVWYSTSSYLGGARDIWILAENKQKHLLLINLIGAIINVLLNMTLIPVYAAVGAAIATVVTQFSINIIFVSIYPPTKRNGILMLKALSPQNILSFIINIKKKRN